MTGRARFHGVASLGRSRSTALLAIETCACATWLIGAWFLSTVFVSPWWSVAAVGSFAWMALLFLRIQPAGAALILTVLVEKASTVVALAFIAFGVKIPELGTVGDAGGHGSAFIVYTALSIVGYVVAFAFLDRRRGRGGYPLTPFFDRFANPVAIVVLAVSGLMILDLLASGARSGFPLLTNTDRFLFRRVMADKWTVYILNFKFVTSFALGFIAFALSASRPLKFAAKATFALLMIFYFLFGDKFFTMLGSLTGFFAPYLYLNSRTVLSRIGGYAIGSIVVLSILFSVTWFIYSEGGRQNSAATAEKLSGRVVGQGELWYLQYELGAPVWGWNESLIDRNVTALTVKDVDVYALRESLGPAYFSNGYAPDKLRDSLHRNAGSVTYTAALEPTGLVLFGWGGLAVMMVLIGVIDAILAAYMAAAIRTRSIVMAVFSAYIAVQLRTTLAQAAPWVLFSLFSLKWLIVIAFIELGLWLAGFSQRRYR